LEGGDIMQNKYVKISAPAKKLLKELVKIYVSNNYDAHKTLLLFSLKYLDKDSPDFSPQNHQLIVELYKAEYIEDSQTLQLTPQGLHYDLCHYSYWLHKAIYPASISLAVSILANVAIIYISQYLCL
jgi:hypothetical protein